MRYLEAMEAVAKEVCGGGGGDAGGDGGGGGGRKGGAGQQQQPEPQQYKHPDDPDILALLAEAGLYKLDPIQFVHPQLESARFEPSHLRSNFTGFKVYSFKFKLVPVRRGAHEPHPVEVLARGAPQRGGGGGRAAASLPGVRMITYIDHPG
jgi:hypothetical protein